MGLTSAMRNFAVIAFFALFAQGLGQKRKAVPEPEGSGNWFADILANLGGGVTPSTLVREKTTNGMKEFVEPEPQGGPSPFVKLFAKKKTGKAGALPERAMPVPPRAMVRGMAPAPTMRLTPFAAIGFFVGSGI